MTISLAQAPVLSNGATATLNGVASLALLTLQNFVFRSGTSTALSTPTDSQGTWANAINPALLNFDGGGSGYCGAQIYYQKNAASGTHTVTPDGSVGSHHYALIEWAGADTAAPLDAAPAAHNVTTANHTSNQSTSTGTLAQADELILATCSLAASAGASDVGWPAPPEIATYTTAQKGINDATDIAGLAVYKIVSSTAAEAPTFNWTATEASVGSQVVIATFKAAITGAPTLTAPTGNSTGETTATVGATTDGTDGTLYVVVTTSSTAPTAAQIKAGQDNAGSAAAYASSVAVSSSGAKTFNATGLAAFTGYTAHLIHTSATPADSNIVSSAQFTTWMTPQRVISPMQSIVFRN